MFFTLSQQSPWFFFFYHDHLKSLVYMVRSIHLGKFENGKWSLTCRLLVSSNLFPTRTISGFFNLPCLSCCPNSIQSGTLSREQQFVTSKQTKMTWQSRRYDGMRQRKRSWPAVSHIWRRTAIPSVVKGTNQWCGKKANNTPNNTVWLTCLTCKLKPAFHQIFAIAFWNNIFLNYINPSPSVGFW